jgi:hypothetical protein
MRTVPGKLLRRTSREWREICIAYGYLLLAWWRLSVRRKGLDRWIFQDTRPAEVSNVPDEADRRSISRSAGWINAAARYPRPWARCLLLERRGFNAQLKIGVRKSGGDLEAHAWVEYFGKVLNDSQDVACNFTLMNGNREMPSVQQLSRAFRG